MDAVFDTLGGEILQRSWSGLKPGGRLVTIAASEEDSQDERTRSPFLIVEPRRAELAEIAGQLDADQVRPIVGGEFPLPDAIVAYETKPLRGKVALRIDDPG